MPDKPGHYPDSCVVHKIADLAKIPLEAREEVERDLSKRINRAIDEAHKHQRARTLRPFRNEETKACLKRVERNARKLRQLLSDMIDTKITENTLAGSYLDAYLGDQQLDLRLYVNYLATLSAAAETTRRQIPAPPPGRPHGTPNRSAFDLFVNSLMLAVENCDGIRLKEF